ncbi:MAG: DUF664 domain-containing protein [Calditrichaeota bacterium]|nr:MAG: DUF664 domain-containing protein [Calditrichota bacterium]
MAENSAEFQALAAALVSECRRRLFQESVPRLKKCLAALTEEEIWFRPNAQTVSVGNLVLHLCGNVRQWLVSGLGGAPDTRQRDQEFSEPGPLPTQVLLARLDETMAEARAVLDGLAAPALLERRSVQAFEETGVSILVHVVEHFSYHVGQVTYFVKSTKGVDLQYYRGVDLNRTGKGRG